MEQGPVTKRPITCRGLPKIIGHEFKVSMGVCLTCAAATLRKVGAGNLPDDLTHPHQISGDSQKAVPCT